MLKSVLTLPSEDKKRGHPEFQWHEPVPPRGSFPVEIEDALLIPKLDGYHAAVPLGLHERAVIDFVRRELHRLAIDLREA